MRLWNVRKVIVIPIVVGALGAITTQFEKFIMEAGIQLRVKFVQKSSLLGTARILRFVLGSLVSWFKELWVPWQLVCGRIYSDYSKVLKIQCFQLRTIKHNKNNKNNN